MCLFTSVLETMLATEALSQLSRRWYIFPPCTVVTAQDNKYLMPVFSQSYCRDRSLTTISRFYAFCVPPTGMHFATLMALSFEILMQAERPLFLGCTYDSV